MERAPRRRVVDQLDGADLGDAIAVQRIKASCLGIDDDLTQGYGVTKKFRRNLL
jgi:hypothetical protein